MSKKQKYYVVWAGLKPGIYTNWNECRKQVDGYPEAKYKSFDDRELAKLAYGDEHKSYYKTAVNKTHVNKSAPDYTNQAIAVDAACSGNPGKMEYRGMIIESKEVIFSSKVFESGTNNIGEFLAIVHALAWQAQRNLSYPVYSDSKIAISWVKAGKSRTKHIVNSKNKELFELLDRAENWLKNNRITVPVLKWDTRNWGEIVADYQRK
jgi:ribonuclease HI